MSLVLINLQSNQQIKLNNDNPLIIGRENVHGCNDKRVSRNHGRITCTLDGKIRLVALHCNPCFFTRNGVPPVIQLNKNEEETLNEGDCLGLLPNAFWFQVTSNKETMIKNEPKDINCIEIINSNGGLKLEENDSLANNTVIFKTENIPNLSTTSSKPNSSDADKVSKSAGTSKVFGSPEFEKTKRLPLWMYEIDELEETDKSSNRKVMKNHQEKPNKKQKITPGNVMTELTTEPKVSTENEVQVTKVVEVLNEASTSKVENTDKSNSLLPHQDSLNSDAQAEGEPSNVTSHKEGYESDVNNVENPPKRPICQYEDKCYRKNPQHKLDFSHPGDTDYTPYEERPLCQYGGACYRKNERHRVEFRHSLPGSSSCNISSPSLADSPLPAKRRREKVKKVNYDYEDDDEYDLEDPFINDASSDEYVPSDLDSNEEDFEDFNESQEDDR